ncbi:DUF1343 domain-containing protein [Ekhidna sp.]|uniref:exo-beta-N-acetylmuramidase NamZ family protein n=1 Tax=Ekhidna sp. TaxID=2608089 RepID=UPI003299941D
MLRLFSLCIIVAFGCSSESANDSTQILTGADQTARYVSLIKGKRVGLTVNHSSQIADTHLTDTLLELGIDIAKVFTPEHGFTGTVSDGAKVEYDSSQASYTLISLYGKNKKPTSEQLDNLDVMVFDIQDVGARFYTYISTMYYVMEACAKNNIPLIILDRPNPNGSYVDGPVLDTAFSSFVGIAPIPLVHGMTIGELAQMFNGEGWLNDGVKCDLNVITIANWNHSKPYSVPIKPSPNLPNDLSISLYPSLCLFEGTIMSVGRGTEHAFQQIGHPEYPEAQHAFTPASREGAKWPPYEDLICYGRSWIGQEPTYVFSLQPLIDAYQKMDRGDFFNDYFKRLAGTDQLRKQIESGMTEDQIRESWENELDQFKQLRAKYLLYK